MMDEESGPDRAQLELAEALQRLAHEEELAGPKGMVVSFSCIGEVVGEDGKRRFFMVSGPDDATMTMAGHAFHLTEIARFLAKEDIRVAMEAEEEE